MCRTAGNCLDQDVTGASGLRRLREFARLFIGEMRRFDQFNRYNPHKFSIGMLL